MDLSLLTDWLLLIVLVVAAIGAVFYSGRWSGKVNAVLEYLKESIEEARNNQKSMEKSIEEVKNNFKSIEITVNEVKNDLELSSLVMKGSPIQLTKLGKKVSTDLSVKSWTEQHAEHVLDQTTGKPEFKVFEMCVEYVACQFNEDPVLNGKIREGAYESGCDVEQLKKVYEVELRDALLSIRG